MASCRKGGMTLLVCVCVHSYSLCLGSRCVSLSPCTTFVMMSPVVKCSHFCIYFQYVPQHKIELGTRCDDASVPGHNLQQTQSFLDNVLS